METRKEDVFKRLRESVIRHDKEAAREAAKEALEIGMPVNEAIDGLAAGLRAIGEAYEVDFFIADLVTGADTFYEGFNILKPLLSREKAEEMKKGVVVIGVVEGDIHDIGKNIVKWLMEARGFEVHDLGHDVKSERFIEEAIKTKADIIALSALMTSTMLKMKKIIEMAREKNLKVKIMIGGGPITEKVCKSFGADAWAKLAPEGVEKALKLVEKGQN